MANTTKKDLANQKAAIQKAKALETCKAQEGLKAHVWGMINVSTRDVASKLTQLSFEGKVIFSVNQSQHIGGNHEVLYYDLVDVVGE